MSFSDMMKDPSCSYPATATVLGSNHDSSKSASFGVYQNNQMMTSTSVPLDSDTVMFMSAATPESQQDYNKQNATGHHKTTCASQYRHDGLADRSSSSMLFLQHPPKDRTSAVMTSAPIVKSQATTNDWQHQQQQQQQPALSSEQARFMYPIPSPPMVSPDGQVFSMAQPYMPSPMMVDAAYPPGQQPFDYQPQQQQHQQAAFQQPMLHSADMSMMADAMFPQPAMIPPVAPVQQAYNDLTVADASNFDKGMMNMAPQPPMMMFMDQPDPYSTHLNHHHHHHHHHHPFQHHQEQQHQQHRRRSTLTSQEGFSDVTAITQQANQAGGNALSRSSSNGGKTRRSMPRRHTVSTPYHGPPKLPGQQVPSQQQHSQQSQHVLHHRASHQDLSSEYTQAKFRKFLKARRHRSLGKLEMPGNKWRSPETATMSSASSLCSPDATDNSQDPWAQFDIKQQQAAAEDRHVEELSNGAHEESGAEEDEKLHCMWSDCGLELDVLEDLIAHVKDVHIGSGKALYYCEWKDCPRNQKPFTKRHKMHNHLRTHTGERPFECAEPGCGKRFSRPDSLTTHAKIHSNVRPYLCQFENCGKAYYHLRSLRKHERSHELRLDDEPVPPIPPVPSQLSHVMTRNSNSVTQHPDASGGLVSLSDDTLLDWCSATPVSSTATAADVVNITATSSTF